MAERIAEIADERLYKLSACSRRRSTENQAAGYHQSACFATAAGEDRPAFRDPVDLRGQPGANLNRLMPF
jgi:hypothetical protein